MAIDSKRVWAEMHREAEHSRMLPETAFDIARRALKTLRDGEIKASDARLLIDEILESHQGANHSVLVHGARKPSRNPEMIQQGKKALESALCTAYTKEADELLSEIEAGKRMRSHTVDLKLIGTKLNHAEANIASLEAEAQKSAAVKIKLLREKALKLSRGPATARSGGNISGSGAAR